MFLVLNSFRVKFLLPKQIFWEKILQSVLYLLYLRTECTFSKIIEIVFLSPVVLPYFYYICRLDLCYGVTIFLWPSYLYDIILCPLSSFSWEKGEKITREFFSLGFLIQKFKSSYNCSIYFSIIRPLFTLTSLEVDGIRIFIRIFKAVKRCLYSDFLKTYVL